MDPSKPLILDPNGESEIPLQPEDDPWQALRALTWSAQGPESVVIAGVDKCMEEVKVLAAALVADVDTGTTVSAGAEQLLQAGITSRERGTITPTALGSKEVNIVEESASTDTMATEGKRPRKQLATRNPDTSRATKQDAQHRQTTSSTPPGTKSSSAPL